ncbi:MAG: hypothetical protein AABY53_05825, partial [Bdellovibrionota bacterium]
VPGRPGGGGGHDTNPFAHAEAVRRMAQNVLEQIEMRSGQLDQRQLMQMSELLRQIDQVMTNGSSQPIVEPIAPVRLNTVSGMMESLSFNFSYLDLNELNSQCLDFLELRRPGAVDDISLNVNSRPTIRLRNGPSYWRGSQICDQIIHNVR